MSMSKEEKKDWRERGYQFTWGAFTAAGGIVAFALVIQAIINLTGIWTDDCDRSAWHRCGMSVLTDAKTGRQYLTTTGGGIVARAPK